MIIPAASKTGSHLRRVISPFISASLGCWVKASAAFSILGSSVTSEDYPVSVRKTYGGHAPPSTVKYASGGPSLPMFFYQISLTSLPGLDPIVFLARLALVLVRSFITFLICFGLGLAGVKFLGRITPGINELRNIKGRPIPTALFATGMFGFLSLTFLGSVISPLPIGPTSGIEPVLQVNPALLLLYRIVTLLAGFLISLLFAAIFYRVLTSAHRPFGINLDNVDEDALATGIYVLGYLIFLGVVLCSCLLLSSSLLFTL